MQRGGGKYGDMVASDDNAYSALGSTDAGRAWAFKALNPSGRVPCVGMPDPTSTDIVMYNYLMNDVVQIDEQNASSTDLYNLEINFYDHPIIKADVIVHNVRTPNDFSYSRTILNAEIPDIPETDPNYPVLVGDAAHMWTDKVALTTANFLYKKAQLLEQVQLGRTCYNGITGTMNANSLNNQGLIHGGQIEQTPIVTQVIDTVSGRIIPQYTYGREDFSTLKTITTWRRSLKNVAATEGFYGVTRLTNEMMSFKNLTTPTSIYCTHLLGVANVATGFTPMPHMFCCIANGTLNFIPQNTNLCQAFITGVSASASFDLTFRHGMESKPREGAMNSPFKNESPRLDPLAMEMYSKLNSEISMDMWTSEYNRLEWLGKLITQSAPYLKAAAHGALANMDQGPMGMLNGAIGGAMKRYKRQRPREIEFVE